MVQREGSELGQSQESSELEKGVGGEIREVMWGLTGHCRSFGFYSEANQEPQEGLE